MHLLSMVKKSEVAILIAVVSFSFIVIFRKVRVTDIF